MWNVTEHPLDMYEGDVNWNRQQNSVSDAGASLRLITATRRSVVCTAVLYAQCKFGLQFNQ